MSLERISAAKLPRSATVASFLDSHCYPPGAAEKVTSPASMATRMNRAQKASQERALKSALLGSESLIVNRTYFFSDNYLSSIIMKENSSSKGSVARLLEDGSLIPFLFSEEDLSERPNLHGLDEQRFQNWTSLCKTCDQVYVTKISWDENNASVLGNKFESFVRHTEFDATRLCVDFGLDPTALAKEVADHLAVIKVLDKKRHFIGREEIYAYLLGIDLRDGPDPFRADMIGQLSPAKAAIRELFDIRYSTNLSDVLDRFSIRGDGVHSRSVLQNDAEMAKGAVHFDTDQIRIIAENIRVANQELDKDDVGIIIPERLSNDDIFYIRGHKVWRDYIKLKDHFLAYDQGNILKHPLLSQDSTKDLAKARIAMAKLVAERSRFAVYDAWRSHFRFAVQWGSFMLMPGIDLVAGAPLAFVMSSPPVARLLERPSTWLANLEIGAIDHNGNFLPTIGEDHPMYRTTVTPAQLAAIDEKIRARPDKSDVAFVYSQIPGLGVEHKDSDQ